MRKKTDKIYLFTTLSVYIGLVLVGASPQAFAQIDNAKLPQIQRPEIRANTSDVFSKLKFKLKFEQNEVFPFAFLGGSNIEKLPPQTGFSLQNQKIRNDLNFFENNQNFTIQNLPRASI